MKIDITRIEEADKSVLRHLFQLYSYDASEFDQADVNRHGVYTYKYLDHYWTEPDRHPFFIKVNGNYAGFVLVNRHLQVSKHKDTHAIAEFFIMRKYRRQGVGKFVAQKIFNRFTGKWEVSQEINNLPAIAFWEKVIDGYTSSNYRVEYIELDRVRRKIMLFDT